MNALEQTVVITAAILAIEAFVERWFIASPRYRGPRSGHFDGRRFHNSASGWQSEGSFLKWQLTRKPGRWPRWIDATSGPPPESSIDDGRARITWINHATLLVQMDGVNLLTDPIWSKRCSPFAFAGPRRHRPPGIRFEDLPALDAVLVSHNHYDHLDLPTLERLRDRRIIVPLGNGALLARHRLPCHELDWWESIPVSERVTATLVPSQHFSARGLSDRNATLWGGFVVSGPSGNVYFAGDTGREAPFEEIAARLGPIRVALLPIGAYLPRWFMSPAHLSPEEAVDAHFALGARTSVAMHFGTFRLGDDGEAEPADDLRRALAERGAPPVLILEHGRAFDAP